MGYDDFKNSVLSSFPFLKENYEEMENLPKLKLEEKIDYNNEINS